MTTTTQTPNVLASEALAPECGPDCIYIDGACRCHYGEPALSASAPAWADDITIPF